MSQRSSGMKLMMPASPQMLQSVGLG